MLSLLLGAEAWHTALERFLLHAQLTVTVLPGVESAVAAAVEVSSGSWEPKGSCLEMYLWFCKRG